MYQLGFRLVVHFKTTVWTSVLWKINMQLAKKWPDIVIKWSFISYHFLRVSQACARLPSTSEASRCRPFKHLKMTVWTSVFWKLTIHFAKKGQEWSKKRPFNSVIHFYSDYSIANLISAIEREQAKIVNFWHKALEAPSIFKFQEPQIFLDM